MTFSASDLLWGALLAPLVTWLAWRLAGKLIDRHTSWVRRALWERIGFRPRARPHYALLLGGVVLFSIIALARPRWGESEQLIEQRGTDVVFVIDSSLSMAAEDLTPNRLGVAKSIVRRMVGSLRGHRLGLVQAEGSGFVLAPLTFDSAMIDLLLDNIEVASLPMPGTRLSRSLLVALELFDEEASGSAVIVLISDGEDHGRNLESVARKIRDRGVVLLTGGVGSTRGVPLPIPGSQAREFKLDNSGQVVVSKLLEEGLEVMARDTGGIYRRFDDAAADLTPFTRRIATLEQRTRNQLLNSRREERFQWPLLAALGCLVGLLMIDPLGKRAS